MQPAKNISLEEKPKKQLRREQEKAKPFSKKSAGSLASLEALKTSDGPWTYLEAVPGHSHFLLKLSQALPRHLHR